jgi:hypothetical protein
MNLSRRIGTLEPGGPGDPDAFQAAEVLSAYFHAERVRAFRRALWARIVVATSVWWPGARLAGLSGNTIFAGALVLASGGLWAVVLEWQAKRKLEELANQTHS